ncbi:hypothetical protein ACIPPQ_00510 [Sphingopyxis sp. LARHCG72]
MTVRKSAPTLLAGIAIISLSACGSGSPDAKKPADEFAWPASLVTVGDGYPAPGAPCRRVGESAATSDFLDDSAALVGCPGRPGDPAATAITTIAGKVVGEVDGVTLISVPAARGMTAPVPAPADEVSDEGGDALVAGTNFNATGTVPCARSAGQPTTECRFGVVRSGDGSATVTIFWPGGGQRAIFFDTAGKPIGFDANQADGSAKAQIRSRRDSDLNLISIGTERYEIPDVVVVGD